MSQQVSQPNENIMRAQASVLCLNNCGFFGNPKTENYCSKCHKEVVLSQRNQAEAKQQQGDVNNSQLTATATTPITTPSTPNTASAPVSSPPTPMNLTATPTLSVPPLAVSQTTPMLLDTDGSAKPEQKKKNRCFSCSKKVGVLGFECRCAYVFCGEHRLPQFHNCTYDMKKHNKDLLYKNNPKVETAKIEKI